MTGLPIDPDLPVPQAPRESPTAWLIRFTEVCPGPAGAAGRRLHVGSLRLSATGALESDLRSAMLQGLLAFEVFPRIEAEDWALSAPDAPQRLAEACQRAVGGRFEVALAAIEEEEEDDERFRETWGSTSPDWGGGAAPWAPLPLRQARQYIQANPDAQVEILFPTVYEEDRSAKVRDLATAQGVGVISHRRMAEQMAKELGQEQYNYDAEQEEIRLHPGPPPPGGGPGTLGAPGGGTALGQAVQATLAPPNVPAAPGHRPDMDADAQARFRNDQKAQLTEALERAEVDLPDA